MEHLRPTTLDELQDIVLDANGRAAPLELVGGGSKAGIGRPEPAPRVLDMSGFDAVIDYDPAELVLTAGAGARLADIETLLDAKGQMLAFEPMDYGPLSGTATGQGTLGGMIAANASGPRRLSAGAARDHFIGLGAVSGRGDLFKGGGRVVKNVTGYDVPKLVAGSWGTLAAVAKVTLKVMPRPRAAATLVIAGLSDDEACHAMSVALGAPACVSAAAHLPAALAAKTPGLAGAPGAITLLRLEGVEPSIAAGMEALARLLAPLGLDRLDDASGPTLWRHLRDACPLAADARPLWRIAAPPADGWRVLAELQELDVAGFYDWAGGLVWIGGPDDAEGGATPIRAAATRLGGHATLVRASAAVRASVPAFQPEPAGLAALSARVKAAFDPAGILGPRHRLAPEAERG